MDEHLPTFGDPADPQQVEIQGGPADELDLNEVASAAQRVLGDTAEPTRPSLDVVFTSPGESYGPDEPHSRQMLNPKDAKVMRDTAAETRADYWEDEYKKTKQELEQTSDRAITDPLTGLYNRAGLEEQFANFKSSHPKEEKRSSQNNETHMLIIDLDDFKIINDTLGHPAGDSELKKVSKAMLGSVRKSDIVARLGGDEFMIILPRSTTEAAKAIAETIRKTIQEQTSVQSSIGMGKVNFLESFEDNFDRVDKPLLAAKKAGKNVIVSADQHYSE